MEAGIITVRVKHMQASGRDRVEIYAGSGSEPFMHAEWPMEGDALPSAVAALYEGIDKADSLICEGIIEEAPVWIYSSVPGAAERVNAGVAD